MLQAGNKIVYSGHYIKGSVVLLRRFVIDEPKSRLGHENGSVSSA
jgi:hypothetical protein